MMLAPQSLSPSSLSLALSGGFCPSSDVSRSFHFHHSITSSFFVQPSITHSLTHLIWTSGGSAKRVLLDPAGRSQCSLSLALSSTHVSSIYVSLRLCLCLGLSILSLSLSFCLCLCVCLSVSLRLFIKKSFIGTKN